jgi:dihydrofolate synthase / folylpolyglutamate synthase
MGYHQDMPRSSVEVNESSPKAHTDSVGNPPKKTKPSARTRRAAGESRGSFVNHRAAVEFLNSRVNVERVQPDKVDSDVWKLDRMGALLKELGNPHHSLEIVHIAGSKGKGSVCNMLECTLEACGYTTGVFTSPHLIDVRERVRIASDPISEPIFDAALERCRDAAATIETEHGKATYFELLTALSLLVFAEQAVDIAILETGIGGRLDCTNVVSPRICGLTSIQLEHVEILGDTLEKIAGEKAGIIKPGVVTISTPQHEDVTQVFKTQSEKVGAQLKTLGDDIAFSRRFQSGVGKGPHARVCVGEDPEEFEHVSVPLMGMHQADNCGLVLSILLELRNHGFDLQERQIVAGLEQINRQGRLEQVLAKPRIYVDGAHTPESVRETLKAVGAHIGYDSLIVIFGCAMDKDIAGILAELDRGADKVLFTRATDNQRACEPDELLASFKELSSTMAESKPSVKEAINDAARAVGINDLILLIGSFYIAGEAKSLIQAKVARRQASL